VIRIRHSRFGLLLSLAIAPCALSTTCEAQALVISEVLTSNRAALADDDGSFSDWVEIHNRLDTAVDLEGWFLTDDPGLPGKWRFPAVTIEAGSYFTVFCSGKTRDDPGAPLHTNFQLDRDGEYLALVQPGGEIEWQYAPRLPRLAQDISYGMAVDPENDAIDLQSRRFFATPSPGAANGSGFAGMAPTPQASLEDGVFVESIDIELTATDASEIRFTLDGSRPTAESELYTDRIALSATARLRAMAFQEDHLPSLVLTRNYVFLDADVQSFNSDLPLVIVHTFGEPISDAEEYTSAYFHFVEPGEDGRTALTDAPNFRGNGGIRVRGYSSRHRPKPSYSCEIWGEEGEDRDVSILGLPPESDWVLYGPYNFDRAMIRNPFMYALSNQVGRYAVRTRFVEVFRRPIDGNIRSGDYFGVYVFMEKVKRSPGRVKIDELLPRHQTEPDISGGYLLKIDRIDPDEIGFRTSRQSPPVRGSTAHFILRYPMANAITPEQFGWIQAHVEELEDAVYGPDFTDGELGYAAYLDVLSFIDHHILNELSKNPDGLRLSTFLHKPRNGRWVAGPIWDFDRTLGSDDDDRSADPEGWYVSTNYMWWGRMAEDPSYERMYRERWRALREGALSVTSLHALIDRLAGEIDEAQARNYQRWGGLVSREGWSGKIDDLKQWLSDRVRWIDEQLLEAPRLTPEGGLVAFPLELELFNPNPTGAIFYTINGLDPKLESGEHAPEAVLHDGNPVILDEISRIRARVLVEGTGWSGLVESTFLDEIPTIAITELMSAPVQGSNAEFVEFFNFGNAPVRLRGIYFLRGVIFEFDETHPEMLAPGEYAVIARRVASFQDAYGDDIPIAGIYLGTLDERGEPILAMGPLGEPIFDFSFSGEWYPLANGPGHSLVLVDPWSPRENWSDSESWQPSLLPGGSPGRADSDEPLGGGQLPGDSNQDGRLNISDALHLVGVLYHGAPFVLPCANGQVTDSENVLVFDVDADLMIDLSDVVWVLRYLFGEGMRPVQGVECREVGGCPEVCATNEV
jgi:hypothetical protein